MRNMICDGNVIEFVVASTARVSGAGELIGKLFGVHARDAAIGEKATVQLYGVFAVTKLTTDAPAQGALLYWDNTNKRLTTTSSGNTLAGWAFAAAINGDTTVQIRLLGGAVV